MMSQRFYTNLAFAVVGGAVVVVSQAFRPSVTGWSMFGVSLGVLAVLGLSQLDSPRDRAQQVLDAGTGALVIWSAVASVVYSGTTLMWLSFVEALGLVGFALTGLVAHELRTEHVVHALEAVAPERRAEERIAA